MTPCVFIVWIRVSDELGLLLLLLLSSTDAAVNKNANIVI